MRLAARSILALALAAVAFCLPGCPGYTHGFALPPGAEGTKTVAVDIFTNKTLYTDVEFEFTQALQREVSAKTPLKIASRENADAAITGAILAYTKKVLRESESDAVSRYSIELTVTYEFTRLPANGKPGSVIRSTESTKTKRLKRSAEYEVMTHHSEADARAEAVRKIARKVVSHIFEPW